MMTPIYAKKINLCVRDTNPGHLDRHLIQECHSTLTECHAEICSALSQKLYNYKITTPALKLTTVVTFTASTPASSNRTRNETTGSSFFSRQKFNLLQKKDFFATIPKPKPKRANGSRFRERASSAIFLFFLLLAGRRAISRRSIATCARHRSI